MNLYKFFQYFCEKHKKINLILSGGKSPLKNYKLMSNQKIDWKNINIFISDERIFQKNSIISNYKNIKDCFKINNQNLMNINVVNNLNGYRQKYIKNQIIKDVKKKPTLSLIGMGDDGHFASIFSGSNNYHNLIDEKKKPNFYQIESIGNPKVKRITMNLSMILNSEKIILFVKSNKKMKLFKNILKNKNSKYPVNFLIKKGRKKLLLFDGNKITRL